MRCIDAHHHLWQYSQAEYGWIGDSMHGLRRDFMPADLHAEINAAEVSQTVAVQARQSLEETRWLLQFAEQHSFIAGVVGWAPIAAPEFPQILESLQNQPLLKGLRHVLQDEPDDRYALHADFQRGLRELEPTGIMYDLLIYAHQLPTMVELVDLHPKQQFVLDHLAKPKIAMHELSPWRENLRELALRPNVACKISGMATEADWQNWSLQDLVPYLDTALEYFGTERLLAGSDWPVCTLATTYSRWWNTLRDWSSALSMSEQNSILAENAERIYHLKEDRS